MTDLVFVTGGNIETTKLYIDGFEVPATQLLVEICAGRDDFGEPIDGGIRNGCNMTAFYRLIDDTDNVYDALPGRITLQFPFHELVIENVTPFVDARGTQVILDGRDVGDQLVDLLVNIDADTCVADAAISIFRNRFLFRDEVIITDLLGA